MRIDLNSDMGESFGVYTMGYDEQVMPFVTSINVACGFHASDPDNMLRTVRLAKKHNVEATEGVIVTKVEADSPAARRGIEAGDIITAVNHKSITSQKQFREAVNRAGAKGVILNLIRARDGASEFKILKDTGD